MGFRYIGSKDRLTDIIISSIKSVGFKVNTVIDLMAGTGLFSLALRENGFKVQAVDVMTYSYHHLNVFLNLDGPPAFDGIVPEKSKGKSAIPTLFESDNYQFVLDYLNELSPVNGYFFNEFSPAGNPTNTSKQRQYFTPENAARIDAIRAEVKAFRHKNLVTEVEHSLLLHDLIMASNDVANIAGTYGHYLSKLIKRSSDPIKLRRSIFARCGSSEGHKVYKAYAEDISSVLEGDLCYIDPPYMKRQYAANYHILETLAREDEPDAIGDSGLRPWRDQYSNFCSKIKIRGSFDRILRDIKCDHFLISYSEDGLLKIEELLDFLKGYGTVTKKAMPYKRFKSNHSKKPPYLDEFLIYLRRG